MVRSVKRILKLSGIVVLVIVDLIAIVLAVRHTNQDPPNDNHSAVTQTSPPTSPATENPVAAAPTGLSVSGTSIVRFSAGACDSSGKAGIEVSSDRGATFAAAALPDGATRILSVDLTSATALSLLGETKACKPVQWTSNDAGKTWQKEPTAVGWYVEAGKVGTPEGAVDPGCTAVSVSVVSDRNAKVACTSGSIRGTDDAGKTWVALGRLDGVSGTVFVTVGTGFALAKTPQCAAQSYSTASAGGTWEPTSCLDKTDPGVAIDGSTKLLAALVGQKLYVSDDQGKTWKVPQ